VQLLQLPGLVSRWKYCHLPLFDFPSAELNQLPVSLSGTGLKHYQSTLFRMMTRKAAAEKEIRS
jgi:hypothetical protein